MRTSEHRSRAARYCWSSGAPPSFASSRSSDSAGFAFYVANFGSYNKIYGALGAFVVMLVWLWITNVAILLGAEVNAERERSRQLREGIPGAEREIQPKERSEPKPKKRSRTA